MNVGNQLFEIDFQKLKDQTKKKYFNVGRIFCPALKADIIFNSDGFHHLSYDSCRKERDKKAQINKFRFFNEAVLLLSKVTTIQEYRRFTQSANGFSKTKIIEWFGFTSVISFSKAIRIKVVIRRVGESNFHFWSVMPFWTLTNYGRAVGPKSLEDE